MTDTLNQALPILGSSYRVTSRDHYKLNL